MNRFQFIRDYLSTIMTLLTRKGQIIIKIIFV